MPSFLLRNLAHPFFVIQRDCGTTNCASGLRYIARDLVGLVMLPALVRYSTCLNGMSGISHRACAAKHGSRH